MFVAVAELDTSSAMVVEMLRDKETRHVLSNTPEVLAKAFLKAFYCKYLYLSIL